MFSQASIGLVLATLEGQHVDVNPAFAEIIGLTIEETLALTSSDITPAKYQHQDKLQLENLRIHGYYGPIEKEYIHKDGHVIYVKLQGKLIELKGVKYIFSSVEDITESKQLETTLRNSENLNKRLVNHLPHKIFIKDLDSRYIICNENYAKDLGITPDDINGKVDYDFFPVELADLYRADDRQVITSGVSKEIEEKYVEKGVDKWIHTIKIPYRDSENNIVGVLGIFEDVTERLLAEEALRQSEVKFQLLTETAPVGIFRTDNFGKTLYVNPQWCEIAKLSAKEALRDGWLDVVHPDDKEALIQNWENAVRQKTVSNSEYRLLRSDDSVAWVVGKSTPQINSDGEVIGHIGTIIDITQRKLIEEEINRVNRVYAVLSNINYTIIHVSDKEALFDEVCRIAIQDGKFEMAWIGLIDGLANKVIPVASNGFVDNYLETINVDLLDNDRKQGPIGMSILTGKHIIVNDIDNNIAMKPWHDNAQRLGYKSLASFPIKVFDKIIGAFVVYSKDQFFFNETEIDLFDEITDNISFAIEFLENEKRRKLDAEEIIRLNNHLHSLIQVIQKLTMARTYDDIMTSVTKMARNLTKADGTTFVLKDDDNCYYADEDTISPLWKGQRFPMKICISGWCMIHKEVVIIEDIYKDNRVPHDVYKPTFVNSMVIIPIRTNEPKGAIGIYWKDHRRPTDDEITTLTTLADATAIAMDNISFYQELESKVKDRTISLEAANKELEAFSYSVSHDLRAPLRHISGYIDLLNRRFADSLSEQGKHYLKNISDSSIQMGMLIDDLLQFSRTGRQELRFTKLDMKSIVLEVIKMIQDDNKTRDIEWSISELPDDLWGDNNLLKLVWHNLLSNAAKFTRKKEKARIEISYMEDKKEYIFTVRDNGAGFDMQYSQKLFGVFQRLHSASEYEGTGIGLANVQRIILRHGGRVWAEAELEKGATFHFTLPKKI